MKLNKIAIIAGILSLAFITSCEKYPLRTLESGKTDNQCRTELQEYSDCMGIPTLAFMNCTVDTANTADATADSASTLFDQCFMDFMMLSAFCPAPSRTCADRGLSAE